MCVYICVCMYVYTCIHVYMCACMCLLTWVGGTWRPEVDIQMSSSFTSLIFWNSVSHRTWSLLVLLDELTREPLGSTCLCPAEPGLQAGTWLGYWRSKLRYPCFYVKHFACEVISSEPWNINLSLSPISKQLNIFKNFNMYTVFTSQCSLRASLPSHPSHVSLPTPLKCMTSLSLMIIYVFYIYEYICRYRQLSLFSCVYVFRTYHLVLNS